MTREKAIEKLEEAQEGMPGPYGEAIRVGLKDIKTMKAIMEILEPEPESSTCEGGACPIKFMTDDGK